MQIRNVKERCTSFVIELIKQVQMRLPENVDILLMLNNFHPSKATSQTKDFIAPIASKYRSAFADMDDLENEWSAISLQKWPQSCLGNIVSFWTEVNERKNSAGQKMFPNVSSLALALLTLPFSNASVERVFSQMNIVHSKLRNRLSVRSVEALLQIRNGLALYYVSCVNFVPSDDMMRNFNVTAPVEDEEGEDVVALDLDE